jgi:hypothetical protein
MTRKLTVPGLFLVHFVNAQEIQLRRSLSGPSGHASGATFVFDETRSRFVYPQDNTFVVYFEWVAPPGLHTISAIWKSPGGAASLSPDVKVDLPGGLLSAYWTFTVHPDDEPGVWTLETRVDGSPGGTHNFELFVPPVPKSDTAISRRPTTDEIYRYAQSAVVVIRPLNAAGERMDTSLGFIYAQDKVATAFQAIDGASTISVVFADGSEVRTDSLAGWSRSSDWAVVSLPTGSRKALKTSSSSSAKVGEKAFAFTLENEKEPVAAIVEITGRAHTSVRFNPALPAVSAGSPVLDAEGAVLGIVGAWDTPGSRIPAIATLNQAVWPANGTVGAIAPIETVALQNPPRSLRSLADAGVLTPPMVPFSSLRYAVTTDSFSKKTDLPDRDVREFSLKAPNVSVVTLWERRDKSKTTLVSAAIYDETNRKRSETPSRKVSLGDAAIRIVQTFGLAGLEPSAYRVDVIADGNVVWRRVLKVIE